MEENAITIEIIFFDERKIVKLSGKDILEIFKEGLVDLGDSRSISFNNEMALEKLFKEDEIEIRLKMKKKKYIYDLGLKK